jgi:hypothetical protein
MTDGGKIRKTNGGKVRKTDIEGMTTWRSPAEWFYGAGLQTLYRMYAVRKRRERMPSKS